MGPMLSLSVRVGFLAEAVAVVISSNSFPGTRASLGTGEIAGRLSTPLSQCSQPPPFGRGTGGQQGENEHAPATLKAPAGRGGRPRYTGTQRVPLPKDSGTDAARGE